jgi:Family of unknown function (DUF6011)
VSDYTSAPACELLASQCAVCSRPLLDAKSVECGVGPECRRKHGFDVDVSDEARAEANAIVYRIAKDQTGADVLVGCARLHALGFSTLAERIAKRIGCVRIEADGDSLIVKAPYSESHVLAMRRVPGRRFDREQKCDRVPVTSKAALWGALKSVWVGRLGIGPSGMFVI